jgi:hypothetical protein
MATRFVTKARMLREEEEQKISGESALKTVAVEIDRNEEDKNKV